MIPRRRIPATVQATRDRWAAITLAEAIVKAEWERIPANIRALTEHRLVGEGR